MSGKHLHLPTKGLVLKLATQGSSYESFDRRHQVLQIGKFRR